LIVTALRWKEKNASVRHTVSDTARKVWV